MSWARLPSAALGLHPRGGRQISLGLLNGSGDSRGGADRAVLEAGTHRYHRVVGAGADGEGDRVAGPRRVGRADVSDGASWAAATTRAPARGGPIRADWPSPLRWCAMAAVGQYLFYGTYSGWWGGHAMGPATSSTSFPSLPHWLPPESGLRASARMAPRRRYRVVVVGARGGSRRLLWNNDPADMDVDHGRLWSLPDLQVGRCSQAGLSPQNFALFHREAFRTARSNLGSSHFHNPRERNSLSSSCFRSRSGRADHGLNTPQVALPGGRSAGDSAR